ncbi:helix-turn-helix domain-containing protein [Chromobacterium sp.]|uniref:helix-turn-helix domain-containing protein n=1 Tax=Chromobacterium sp. TaxID=306190 RepID=UPI0035B178B0
MEQQFEQQGQPADARVGARLKAAREAAGMGLGEVADRLKLSMRQLEAIERDDFAILPGATFVRGFVRNYARFLQIDPEPLMHALDRQFPSAVNDVANLVRDGGHDSQPQPTETLESSGGGGSSGKWIIALLVLAALGGGVAWLASNHESDSRQAGGESSVPLASELASAPSGEASAPMLAIDAPASTPVVAPVAVPASAPQAVKIVNAASAPVQSAPPAAKPQASAAAAASGKLVLTVKDAEAWVSVVDATGKKLVFQTLQPGSTQEAVGTPPFKLVIGNAAQVAVNFNGQAVDLSDKIRGTTAKLELK